MIAQAVRSSLMPEESESLLWVQLLQQMQGTGRGGRNGVSSSDSRGPQSAVQLFQSVGEVEGVSPVGQLSAEELGNGRLEEEQVSFSEGEKRWC